MTRQHHSTPPRRSEPPGQLFTKPLAQRRVQGSPGTPPEITLAYGESTNRITTAGYSYDLNGNLTAIPSINGAPAITSMAWDKFDRMTSITRGGVTSTYGYDAFGRRVRRSVGSSHRIFFYDISGRLLAEYDSFYSTAPPSRINRYFAGQRLGQYTDRLGSVRVAGGASSQYYPYGEEVTSTSNDRHKFAQLYRDSDTGLDYAMARYYAPAVGRFASPDPYMGSVGLASPQSWNRYLYVENDPVNFADPTGLVRFDCTIDGIFVPCSSVYDPIAGNLMGGPSINTLLSTGLWGMWLRDGFEGATGYFFTPQRIADRPPGISDTRYAAGLKVVGDCYYPNGYEYMVGYVRKVTYQVVDQRGDPYRGATVEEKVRTTSGPEINPRGNAVWRPGYGMNPDGTFDDYMTANGSEPSTAKQTFFSRGTALYINTSQHKELDNRYSKEQVLIDDKATTTPCDSNQR